MRVAPSSGAEILEARRTTSALLPPLQDFCAAAHHLLARVPSP